MHLRLKLELQHQCGISESEDLISEQAGSGKQPSSQIDNANKLAETPFYNNRICVQGSPRHTALPLLGFTKEKLHCVLFLAICIFDIPLHC
jgi:hypothetical protein